MLFNGWFTTTPWTLLTYVSRINYSTLIIYQWHSNLMAAKIRLTLQTAKQIIQWQMQKKKWFQKTRSQYQLKTKGHKKIKFTNSFFFVYLIHRSLLKINRSQVNDTCKQSGMQWACNLGHCILVFHVWWGRRNNKIKIKVRYTSEGWIGYITGTSCSIALFLGREA